MHIQVPASLTTVTPLSKAFAFALFILLPIIGFVLGVVYGMTQPTTDIDAPVQPGLRTPPAGDADVDGIGQGEPPLSIGTTPVPTTPAPPTPTDTAPGVMPGDDGSGVPPYVPDEPAPTEPEDPTCGITSCHGRITCGRVPTPGLACSMEYRMGDGCRSLATCGVNENGVCAVQPQTGYEPCFACAEACDRENQNDPMKAFDCEATCMERYNL